MTGLQEALDFLGPITWDEFPRTQEGLREYISEIAQKARLIAESVPEPPPVEESDDSSDAAHHSAGNSTGHGARKNKAYDVTTSAARYGTTDPDLLSYQRQWSKPLKPGNRRDNPHGIQQYKLQGHDGKGTWFGRRSVHDGMPFSHWKQKMSSELEETLRWNTARLEKGQSPDRVVRGMGVAKKAEDVEVVDADGTTILGSVRVYDIAAHFPKPTTPRDFVQVGFSWNDPVGTDEGSSLPRGRRCRSWLSVSKPCLHPDLPQQEGYIRGQYESVEFIREILPAAAEKVDGHRSSTSLAKRKSVSWSDLNLVQHEQTSEPPKQDDKKDKKQPKHGKTESSAQEKPNEQQSDSSVAASNDVPDDEANPFPVEWIMITRSDPGGSIPRWVVEKGTPKSIWGDTSKFLDWASREEPPDDGTGDISSNRASEDEHRDSDADEGFDEIHPEERHNGLIANFSYLLNAGLERYAPQMVLDYVPYRNRGTPEPGTSDDDDDDDDSTSTISTIHSSRRKKTESMASQSKVSLSEESHYDTQSQQQRIASIDAMQLDKKEKLTSHEKQLVKLGTRKAEIQSKLQETRNEIDALRLDAGTTADNNSNSAADKKERKEKEKQEKKEKKDRERQEKQDRKDREKQEKQDRKDREKQEKQEKHEKHERKHENKDKDNKDDDNAAIRSSSSTDITRTESRSPSTSSNHREAQQTNNNNNNSSSRSSSKTRTSTDHHNLPKAASNLFATESKLLKQLTKIERDQLRTVAKIEAHQNKQQEREEKTRTRADMEALRREVDGLKKEVERLRGERGQWVDLVASLQAENVKLSRGDGKGENGEGGG